MASEPEWPLKADVKYWPAVVPRAENGWPLRLVGRNNLPRSLCLKSRADIGRLLKDGRRFPTDCFTLVWQPAEQFKYGIFLSRKLGPAVRRNRIKRLYREAIRLSRNRLEKTGRIAVLPKAHRKEPELGRLIEDVCNIFEQLNCHS